MNTRLPKVGLLSALAVFVLGMPSETWACGCAPLVDIVPLPSLASQVAAELQRVDFVFMGTARRDSGPAVFTVEAYWKGDVKREFAMSGGEIEADGTELINTCETGFEDRARYVVFVQRFHGRWIAGACGFTRRVPEAADVLAALDALTPRRQPQ